MIKVRYALPLALFLALVVLFKIGLGKDPNLLPSILIGKPLPNFDTESLQLNQPRINNQLFQGKITLLNVWASWCQNCQLEHPLLIDLAKNDLLTVYSLNYKDNRQQAELFLTQMGNPYSATIYDPEAKLAMQIGVYDLPETFLIDKKGIVRYRYAGPLTLDTVENDLLPRIKLIAQEG